MATITDVCRAAGVSKATVSRVLNNTGQVKESTRQLVAQAIKELDFRPNSLAQALANQRSDTIGLIISDFAGGYFGRLMRQATRSADEAGMQLIVTDGHDSPERELKAVDMLVYRRCDAILLYSRCISAEQLTRLTRELPVPLIVLNRSLPEAEDRSIVFEQRGAAQMVVDHLIQLGHRQIACITPRHNSRTGQQRLSGYKDGLHNAGIPVDEQLIAEGAFTPASGYEACQKLLQTGKPFTALFCCSDMMAEGAYRALAEHGLKIPGDVSVIGFDNDASSAFMVPALTTVKLPISAMTRQAVQQAVNLSKGLPVTAVAPFTGQLILRESVVPIAGNTGHTRLSPPTDMEEED